MPVMHTIAMAMGGAHSQPHYCGQSIAQRSSRTKHPATVKKEGSKGVRRFKDTLLKAEGTVICGRL